MAPVIVHAEPCIARTSEFSTAIINPPERTVNLLSFQKEPPLVIILDIFPVRFFSMYEKTRYSININTRLNNMPDHKPPVISLVVIISPGKIGFSTGL
ncbi:hypothetical protein OkiPb00429_27780 [Escherichia coli]|nr:hypothetical protein CL8F690_44080 [Escherichia coli]BDM93751.1 hypothetical protein CL8F765_44270 [Escherichia coli]BDM99023.1 hypothetical protein CL8FH52_43660 [Escherichia coli]BDN14962.1 hypothetical protein CL8NIID27_43610 [Escherichia coli]BDN20246.1 hypothetical protein CL8NIID53_43190 [Escherichia coli]